MPVERQGERERDAGRVGGLQTSAGLALHVGIWVDGGRGDVRLRLIG